MPPAEIISCKKEKRGKKRKASVQEEKETISITQTIYSI